MVAPVVVSAVFSVVVIAAFVVDSPPAELADTGIVCIVVSAGGVSVRLSVVDSVRAV